MTLYTEFSKYKLALINLNLPARISILFIIKLDVIIINIIICISITTILLVLEVIIQICLRQIPRNYSNMLNYANYRFK
jgi:hypothetical protein